MIRFGIDGFVFAKTKFVFAKTKVVLAKTKVVFAKTRSFSNLIKIKINWISVTDDQYQDTIWTGRVCHIPQMMSGTPNRSRTPGNQFFHVLSSFWPNLWFWSIFRRSGDQKKIDLTKKNQNFPKVKHMPGISSKAQPQAPRELGEIRNLAKTSFFRKKDVFREQFEFTL